MQEPLTFINNTTFDIIFLKINPVSITEGISMSYDSGGDNSQLNPEQSKNNTQQPQKKLPTYKKHNYGNLSFKIILLDKLGIEYNGKVVEDVDTQIRNLKTTIYHYDKEEHGQPSVMITWGGLTYENCFLSDMNMNYTLFNQSGNVLRAEIDLKFIVGLDKETEDKMKKNNSPDMSRIRVLNDEDKLSLMCAKFYGDSSKELQVAKENGIINFRKVKAGTEVYFPPIKK